MVPDAPAVQTTVELRCDRIAISVIADGIRRCVWSDRGNLDDQLFGQLDDFEAEIRWVVKLIQNLDRDRLLDLRGTGCKAINLIVRREGQREREDRFEVDSRGRRQTGDRGRIKIDHSRGTNGTWEVEYDVETNRIVRSRCRGVIFDTHHVGDHDRRLTKIIV